MITTLSNFGYGSSKYLQIEEQLAIFLYMSVTGPTIHHTSKCFQCSNKTIFKYFHHILGIFSSEPFYTTYINLPVNNTPPSPQIYCNLKLSPFKNTLGALDGSHFVCAPPLHSCASHQNQMGFMSQNCLFTCNFNFQFTFCYTSVTGRSEGGSVQGGECQWS